MSKLKRLKQSISVILISGFILISRLVFAAGQESGMNPEQTAFRADVRTLMTLTNAGDIGEQAMEQLISIYQQSGLGIPDKFWNDFMAEFDAAELVELCIPLYEKYYTHEEIKQLIAFYKSPIGKKMAATQGSIMQESMIIGQQWGQSLGERVAQKLAEEGYFDQPAQ